MRKDKPSRTACKVALNTITLSTIPEMREVMPSGLPEATAQLLVASGAAGPKTVRIAHSPKCVGLYRAFDWMLPGQFEAFAHRKAFGERHVRDGLDSGATQVLVLGAGYDTLGWRLAPEYPQVRFFEIDHPATAVFKARGIDAMGPRKNLHLIAEDLSQRTLADVLLGDENWDGEADTVVIAEGLLMYLTGDSVCDLFRQCKAITGAGSRVVFSYIPADDRGRLDAGPWTGLVVWLQEKLGEPWLWSIPPTRLPEFLADLGWKLVDSPEKHGVEFFCAAVRDGTSDS